MRFLAIALSIVLSACNGLQPLQTKNLSSGLNFETMDHRSNIWQCQVSVHQLDVINTRYEGLLEGDIKLVPIGDMQSCRDLLETLFQKHCGYGVYRQIRTQFAIAGLEYIGGTERFISYVVDTQREVRNCPTAPALRDCGTQDGAFRADGATWIRTLAQEPRSADCPTGMSGNRVIYYNRTLPLICRDGTVYRTADAAETVARDDQSQCLATPTNTASRDCGTQDGALRRNNDSWYRPLSQESRSSECPAPLIGARVSYYNRSQPLQCRDGVVTNNGAVVSELVRNDDSLCAQPAATSVGSNTSSGNSSSSNTSTGTSTGPATTTTATEGNVTVCVFLNGAPLSGVSVGGIMTTNGDGCASTRYRFGTYQIHFSHALGEGDRTISHYSDGTRFNAEF